MEVERNGAQSHEPSTHLVGFGPAVIADEREVALPNLEDVSVCQTKVKSVTLTTHTVRARPMLTLTTHTVRARPMLTHTTHTVRARPMLGTRSQGTVPNY